MAEDEAVEPKYGVQFDGDEAKREYLSADGRAEAKFANGDRYVGYYSGGKRHGRGVYTWSAGAGAGTGDGDQSAAAGAVAGVASYDGDWDQGRRHGQGVMIYPDHSQYDGEWRQDQIHGHGIYLYSNGDRFIGEYDHGVKQGMGTYIYGHDGAMIKGRWIQGKLVTGQWHTKDGTKISGAFHDHIPDGEVHIVFPSGNQQNGIFQNGYWHPGEMSAWE